LKATPLDTNRKTLAIFEEGNGREVMPFSRILGMMVDNGRIYY
jgi:hypothetical protein